MNKAALVRKVFLLFAASILVLCIMFFLPAGTLDYWQAWAYLAVVLLPAALVVLYFLKTDPAFLERRLKMREKEAPQKFVQKLGAFIFIFGFPIPGLDRRFGWSSVPAEWSVAADAAVFLGYLLVFLVFRENSYAGRTIRVEKGQKVISTGPYSVIRHPMYLGMLLLYLATPLALGSWWALPVFSLILPLLVLRILNEEEVLRRGLKGYPAYCQKVRYRLIPLVW
ncbi:Phospholipid methyltransferase [uncultured archaeon]|nr:Phospholipid methyltransferase [uncultured archaeon]